jgi:hypothetical protein
MRGYPIIFGERVDPDAYQYFLRAGIASGTQTPSSYDNAASFNGASSQSLTSTAANLQCQSQSFTVAGWFFMLSNAPAYSALITQGGHPSAAGGGFTLQRFDNLNLVYLTIRNDNASNSVAVNSSVFVPSAWNFIECGWDSTLNQSFISLNGGTRAFSTAVAGWTFPNTTNITRLGRDPFGSFLTGNLAGWGLWKRALSASEVTALWNNGAGRTYASLDSGLQTNLISWWALNQNSVTADSAPTGNNLTNSTPAVTATNIGPIVTTTQNSRQLINNFVKGIKSLGLWNSMVCWPLRSSQNASTTLTARSRGGLGTFDGTFAGSLPVSAWGSQGITNTSTGFINTNLSVPSIPTHNMVVVNPSSTANQCYCSDLSSSNSRGIRATRQTLLVGNGTSFNIISYSNPTINTFRAIDYDVTALLATISLNGSSIATGSLSALPPAAIVTMKLMAAVDELGPSQWFPGTMSFYMHFSTNLTTTQVPEVYSLYKQTIGIGLALP